MKGKLIVIDAGDGSGKTVQTNLLYERLQSEGYDVELLNFPQYGKPSAYFIERMLCGEYGVLDELDPYMCSLFYTLDRFDVSQEIKDKLKQGKIFISNRYVSANMGHQGGKIKNQSERKKFLEWLDHMEYEVFKVPRPDLVLYLHVPAVVSIKLIKKRIKEGNNNRSFLKGINEIGFEHLENAEKSYLECEERFVNWQKIECVNENNEIRDVNDIHEELYAKVEKIIFSR